jgi:predicted permease
MRRHLIQYSGVILSKNVRGSHKIHLRTAVSEPPINNLGVGTFCKAQHFKFQDRRADNIKSYLGEIVNEQGSRKEEGYSRVH